ncbi:hypothetical protein MRB53_029550 [Persea americana]|uniref:Uncharacterized protein n=1 Tax=Persea americana TaxID=3435 RepID=A0ACC2KJ20_PERAE|nr:hypothetical protein MRB53_029550 [Persea americana]
MIRRKGNISRKNQKYRNIEIVQRNTEKIRTQTMSLLSWDHFMQLPLLGWLISDDRLFCGISDEVQIEADGYMDALDRNKARRAGPKRYWA